MTTDGRTDGWTDGPKTIVPLDLRRGTKSYHEINLTIFVVSL